MGFSLRLLPVFQMNARKLVGVILLMATYERDGVLSPDDGAVWYWTKNAGKA